MKIGTHFCALEVREALNERALLPCHSFSIPTKQKSVASSQPTACPTSSAITNWRVVPGLMRTRARNKLLKRTATPTLYQNGRVKDMRLILILHYILMHVSYVR